MRPLRRSGVRNTHHLEVVVETGDRLAVRHFQVRESLHDLFRVELEVETHDRDLDLEALIGAGARFSLQRAEGLPRRSWEGLITSCEHLEIADDVIASYRLVIHPTLWLLTQRRNYRIFQQSSDPDIALKVLADWGLTPLRAYDDDLYPGRKYRVQYAESDFAFVRRLLEDAGITFMFTEHEGKTRLSLSDAPHRASVRPVPVHYENRPSGELLKEVATAVRVRRTLRPGRYTQRDVDYRRPPEFPLMAHASGGSELEHRLERFHHNYGAFLFSAAGDDASPVADDRGAARTDLVVGERQVARRLAAKRTEARRCHFVTTAHDLAPGVVFSFGAHPRRDLSESERLLVIAGELRGSAIGDWTHEVESCFASEPYHPPLSTPKPRTHGVESATVVGPDHDDIHTDEFGRVRVHFHWDREGRHDPDASCWIPVSQPWGGAGFGGVNIPRVGQEVLVDFLGADPDRPVITGRVFTKTNPVPYKLPEHRTVSGLRSRSANRMVMGASDGNTAPTGGAPLRVPQAPLPGAMPSGSGLPMDPARLQQTLDEELFGALSPNAGTHRWPGSELTMDDRLGRELVYLQAERDMSTVIKDSATTVVGNRRCTRIGTDDVVNVDNEQLIRTGADRCVRVEASQTHVVEHDVRQQSVQGNQIFETKETFASRAKHHVVVSQETVTLNVGDSTLFMRPDFVILQTPMLFMNPGQDALAAAMQSGTRPMTPEEAARAAFDAEVAAARATLERAWQDGRIADSRQLAEYNIDYTNNMDRFSDPARTQALRDFDMAHAPNLDMPADRRLGHWHPYDVYTPPPTVGPQ